MRIRLRIERNELPPTRTIWPVKNPSHTIDQLLQAVNDRIPLEAGSWGLEDYIVLLGDYDLLHYHLVKDVLKEEDEVVIRPLTKTERQQRVLLGRNLIDGNGRHMYDGVPFGKTAEVRGPLRPNIKIPPRKRQRLMGDEEEEEEAEAPLLLTNGAAPPAVAAEEEYGSESEEDDDFQPPESSEFANGNVTASDLSSDVSSSEDESDSDSDSSLSSDDSSSDSDSDSDSSDGVLHPNEQPWEGFADDETTSDTNTSPAQNTQPKLKSCLKKPQTPQADPPQPPVAREPAEPVGIPGEGQASTKARNARRRDAKRLKHLKANGSVPQNMTLAEMRAFDEGDQNAIQAAADRSNGIQVNGNGQAEADANANVDTEEQRATRDQVQADADAYFDAAAELDAELEAELDDEERAVRDQIQADTDAYLNAAANNTRKERPAASADTVNAAKAAKKGKRAKKVKHATDTGAGIEERRQQLLSAINSGGVNVNGVDGAEDEDENEAPEELSAKEQAAATGSISSSATMVPPSVAAAKRRAKLDSAGAKRSIFGALGVRVPKTQVEKDALQEKLAARSKRKAVEAATTNGDQQVPTTSSTNGEQPVPNDFDAWRDKINLTAVECVDKDVTLSEPPFPFHQRWDPQYNRRGKKRTSTGQPQSGNKKRKRNARQSDEEYDKYNANGYGDALNYDEEEEDEYWEEGALLNGSAGEEPEEDEDLAPLPEDLKTLPIVPYPDVEVGDIITYAELACDASTDWQPQMARRTARVLDADREVDSLTVQLAKRDVKAPEFDEEGNRVFSKFEMPGEEGDDDGRVKEVEWVELGEVRMVEKGK